MAYNDNGVNWFGQVGASRTTQPRPQVSAPALSQIPGLNKASGDAPDTDEPQRQFFRDTDSAYVRLAKQGGRTDLLRMDQDSAAMETKANAYAIPSWMQQDSGNEDLPNTDLDFLNNEGRSDQWDARQSSPPPGDRNSDYIWSRKTSAEGGRQSLQSESQSAYMNKQSGDGESPANRRGDSFQQQYTRQNVADATSRAGRTSFQSPEEKSQDNTRPEWLQWNPANNSKRESASGRQHEENVDVRSPNGRYQGNSSPQKPYADHGYQMPLSSETSSAYAEKPFQSPAGERRSSASNLREEFYSKNTYQVPSQQQSSVASNHQQQQPAGINRLKHSDSMSKLMSFGYLKDSEKDSSQVAARQSQPRIQQGYVPNTYTTEYKEKMHSTGGANGTNPSTLHNASIQSTGTYVPTPISDPGYRRRKQSIEERPDFFRIGSTDPQSAYGSRRPSAETRPDFFGSERTDPQSTSNLAYGFRKPSAETRPDFFGNERVSNAAAISYGKIRHEGESKPDFFKIGSLDNYLEKHGEQKKPDDGGILDKLNGYHGISQKTNYRRRKMDINGPMLTTPVKAVSRF